MSLIRIDTMDDHRLAPFRNVSDAELLKREGSFVAEGRLVVRRLLTESRLAARSLMLTEPALGALTGIDLTVSPLPVYVVPQAVMNGVTGFNFHRGCLAIGVRPPARAWQELSVHTNRLVILERVGNADNVGSVFRNSAAFGVDGVVLQTDCADPLYRKAIRTSMGAALTLPFAWGAPWPDLLNELGEMGWATIAMTPATSALPLREVVEGLAAPRHAIVLGHEGDGLTPAALSACRYQARIPMASDVDSINVATAAALALYEITR